MKYSYWFNTYGQSREENNFSTPDCVSSKSQTFLKNGNKKDIGRF